MVVTVNGTLNATVPIVQFKMLLDDVPSTFQFVQT